MTDLKLSKVNQQAICVLQYVQCSSSNRQVISRTLIDADLDLEVTEEDLIDRC